MNEEKIAQGVDTIIEQLDWRQKCRIAISLVEDIIGDYALGDDRLKITKVGQEFVGLLRREVLEIDLANAYAKPTPSEHLGMASILP